MMVSPSHQLYRFILGLVFLVYVCPIENKYIGDIDVKK